MTRSRSLSNVHGAGGLDWGFVIGLVMVLRACVGLGEREWEWRGGRELRGTEAGSSAGRALGFFFLGGGGFWWSLAVDRVLCCGLVWTWFSFLLGLVWPGDYFVLLCLTGSIALRYGTYSA